MARNKHPEATVERILDVAQRLFLEKGYDRTTIQDIVDGLDGLTKGAVYHHFKSKEEIMSAVGDRMFFENNPFEAVRARGDLNGLEKLREAVRLNQADEARSRMTVQAVPITQNPRVLVEMIESNRRVLTPYFFAADRGGKPGRLHSHRLSQGACRAAAAADQPVAAARRVSGHPGGAGAQVPLYRRDAGEDGPSAV